MNNLKMVLVITAALLATFAAKSNGASFQVTTSTQLQTDLDTARTNGEDDIIYLQQGDYVTNGAPFIYGTTSNDNHSVTLSGGWDSTFTSQISDPNATRLDGNGANQVLQILAIASGVNITFTIKNLAIINGHTSGSDPCGAGIEACTGPAGQGSIHLDINNCLFQNNNADNSKGGGAIYSIGTLNVSDSTFLTNMASSGGAMVIGYDSDDGVSAINTVKNCNFEDNSNYGNQGHDIYYNCDLRVSGCTFKGRSDGTSSSGNGSALYGTAGSYLRIANSSFLGIRVAYWGSAIQTFNGAMDITNCLFYDNHAGAGTNGGYGTIAYYDNGNPTGEKAINITNCTFSGNTDASTYSPVIHNRGGVFNLNNCIFWENDGLTGVYNEYGSTTMRYCTYSGGGMGFGVTDGGNNYYMNPMFVSDIDFRLGSASPCIDAGNNDLVPADVLDVDNDGNTVEQTPLDMAGQSRFLDDPCKIDIGQGTAPIVDIGAYEYKYIVKRLLEIVQCTVTAGNKPKRDKITFSGIMDANGHDFKNGDIVKITIGSSSTDNKPFEQNFPIDANTFKKDKYNFSKSVGGVKKTFTYDIKTNKFTFSVSNVDLSGLDCPVSIGIKIGDYAGTAQVDEDIINGKKPIPIDLMMGVKNSLRVDNIKVKSPNNDQLSIKGAFTAKDTNMIINKDLIVTLDTQQFSIFKDKFKIGNGKISCSNANVNEGGTAASEFNFNKCSFKMTIKKTEYTANFGNVNFCVDFDDFSECVSVVLPCIFSISPTSQSFTADSGNGSVYVTSSNGCDWTANSNVNWISVASIGGTGNGTIEYTVSKNSGPMRTGTITIAGKTFKVTQRAGGSGGGHLYGSISCSDWSFSVSNEDWSNIEWIVIDSMTNMLGQITYEKGKVTAVNTGHTYTYEANISWNSFGCIMVVQLKVSGGILSPHTQKINF